MGSNVDSAVRSGLLSKVTMLLVPSLLISAYGTYLGTEIKSLAAQIFLLVLFFIGPWVVRGAAKAGRGIATACLLGWAFVSGLFIGPAIEQYIVHDGWQTVFNAYLFTSAAMCVFGGYGLMTQRNLSAWLAPLFWALLALLVVMIVALFIHVGAVGNILISLAGMAIFAGLFIFDFNRIKHEEDNWENAWDATINIMLDYMNFLLFFLQFMGASKDD